MKKLTYLLLTLIIPFVIAEGNVTNETTSENIPTQVTVSNIQIDDSALLAGEYISTTATITALSTENVPAHYEFQIIDAEENIVYSRSEDIIIPYYGSGWASENFVPKNEGIGPGNYKIKVIATTADGGRDEKIKSFSILRV